MATRKRLQHYGGGLKMNFRMGTSANQWPSILLGFAKFATKRMGQFQLLNRIRLLRTFIRHQQLHQVLSRLIFLCTNFSKLNFKKMPQRPSFQQYAMARENNKAAAAATRGIHGLFKINIENY
jgi:hypothetical protein